MKGSYSAAHVAITAQILNTILCHETLSYAQIAALLGVSPSSVYRIARNNKVTRQRGRKLISSR